MNLRFSSYNFVYYIIIDLYKLNFNKFINFELFDEFKINKFSQNKINHFDSYIFVAVAI